MTKSEAARANGRKGGRPRKPREQPPQTAQDAPVVTLTPEPLFAPEPTATAPETPAVVPALDNPFDLNPRQFLFVEAYFGAAHFNASEAYRLAGYEGAPESVSANAARLIGSDRVHQAVAARTAALAARLGPIMDGDEALTRISTFARGDIRKLFPPESRIAQLPDEVAACIKSITPNKFGMRIELIDPLRASELMAKVSGRLKETIKVEHTLEEIMSLANQQPQQGTAA